jgi:hypothetical protein
MSTIDVIPKRPHEHDREALRAEVVILGLFAASLVVFPGPLTALLGATIGYWAALGFVGLWFVYALKLYTAGRLT